MICRPGIGILLGLSAAALVESAQQNRANWTVPSIFGLGAVAYATACFYSAISPAVCHD
jgi:hypothetical protein